MLLAGCALTFKQSSRLKAATTATAPASSSPKHVRRVTANKGVTRHTCPNCAVHAKRRTTRGQASKSSRASGGSFDTDQQENQNELGSVPCGAYAGKHSRATASGWEPSVALTGLHTSFACRRFHHFGLRMLMME